MATRVDLGGPIDYFSALYGEEAAQVPLTNGGTLTLRRPGLGKSYHMDHLGQQIRDSDLAQRVGHLRQWLTVGGVPDPDALALGDIINIAQVLQAMAAPRGALPFQIPQPTEKEPEAGPVEYAGRDLAVIVHSLAEAYGWGLEEILALPREVALAHAQEILITDRRRREWEHMLSEVAWGYNKTTQKSEYRPLPPPSWDRPEPKPYAGPQVPEEIRAKYDPKGVVVDLTKNAKEAENAHGTNTEPTQPGHNGDTKAT